MPTSMPTVSGCSFAPNAWTRRRIRWNSGSCTSRRTTVRTVSEWSARNLRGRDFRSVASWRTERSWLGVSSTGGSCCYAASPENDSGRIEYINRIRFWRFLLGDESFDADYWVTRIENEPEAIT